MANIKHVLPGKKHHNLPKKRFQFPLEKLFFPQWFSVTFVYYGLSFTSTSMAGDPFTNFCLTILVEIPGINIRIFNKIEMLKYLLLFLGYLFAVFVMDCWGRRPILAFCQVLPGLACVLSGLLVTYPELAPVQVRIPIVISLFDKL